MQESTGDLEGLEHKASYDLIGITCLLISGVAARISGADESRELLRGGATRSVESFRLPVLSCESAWQAA